MAYILDGVIVLIVVLTVALGYRRGFIRSMVQLVGLVAAFMLAFSFSETLSTYVYDAFISEPLRETVTQTLQTDVSSTASEQLDSALETLPPFLSEALRENEQANAALESLGAQVDASAAQLAEMLVTNVIRPLAVALLRFVLFLVLVVLLLLAVKLLTALLKPITKLPVIRQADGALGAVIGLLKSLLFVLIAVTVMQLLASTDTLITAEQVQDSLLVSWLAQNNPVAGQLSFLM